MSEFAGPSVPEEFLMDHQEALRERLAAAIDAIRQETVEDGWGDVEWADHIVSDVVEITKHFEGAGSADEFLEKNFPHDVEDEGELVTLPVQAESISGSEYVVLMALYPSNAVRSLSAADIEITDGTIRARIDDPLAPLDPDAEVPDFDPINPVTGFDSKYAVFAVDVAYAYPESFEAQDE